MTTADKKSNPCTPQAFSLSFEFFPPKTPEGEQALWAAITALDRFEPSFISLTYGAGGGDREKTRELVRKVRNRINRCMVAHLTCVGESRERLVDILDFYRSCQVTHILALRGDQPQNAPPGALEKGAFRYADAFVAFIRKHYPEFHIGVAAFPEIHPEAASPEADLEAFRRKVATGADFAVTQFFFENSSYYRFVASCRAAGVTIPIYPGIIPLTNFKQIKRFAQLGGADLPTWLTDKFLPIQEDPEKMVATGIQVAADQCRDLLDHGVSGLHFFTLNRSDVISRILETLAPHVAARLPQQR